MNSKQIKNLSMRVKTIKFLAENIGVNLSELGFAMASQIWQPKETKQISYISSKMNTSVVKGLLPRTFKSSYNSVAKQQTTQLKMGEGPE